MNHFAIVSTTEKGIFQWQIVFDGWHDQAMLAMGGTVKLRLAVAGTERLNVTH
jgi:hypothetical protein